jgi:hypothetical protein
MVAVLCKHQQLLLSRYLLPDALEREPRQDDFLIQVVAVKLPWSGKIWEM